MSGNCAGIENWRGQLGDCIDELNHVQQSLFTGNVISDTNIFAKSLNKLKGATADISRVVVAPCDAVDSTASEMIDLTGDVSKDETRSVSNNNVDEFDSIMCGMDDEEFENVVNSQIMSQSPPATSTIHSNITGDIPSPCQQHVDKLKEVFGHSQFKL